MAVIKEVLGKSPRISDDVFLAETAVLIGDVEIGSKSSVWYNAVLRGDVNAIRIGSRVNIQDNVTVHCTYKKHSVKIGDDVSVGHNAIIHGCEIHSCVLVGMGAIVMDDCVLETNSIVAAGSVVTKASRVRSGEIWAGVPAKRIRLFSSDAVHDEIERIASSYIKYSGWYTGK